MVSRLQFDFAVGQPGDVEEVVDQPREVFHLAVEDPVGPIVVGAVLVFSQELKRRCRSTRADSGAREQAWPGTRSCGDRPR